VFDSEQLWPCCRSHRAVFKASFYDLSSPPEARSSSLEKIGLGRLMFPLHEADAHRRQGRSPFAKTGTGSSLRPRCVSRFAPSRTVPEKTNGVVPRTCGVPPPARLKIMCFTPFFLLRLSVPIAPSFFFFSPRFFSRPVFPSLGQAFFPYRPIGRCFPPFFYTNFLAQTNGVASPFAGTLFERATSPNFLLPHH